MEWALNHRGDLISAGRVSRFETGLRCPQCAERVNLRRGVVYRAHFAHVSGARKLECDLYFPGGKGRPAEGAPRGPFEGLLDDVTATRGVILVWDPERDMQSALSVRVPSTPGVVISLVSKRGTSVVRPRDGARPVYAKVGLATPPATCETSPYTPSAQESIERALASFRLSWNYFRLNASGTATIVDPAAPLEEGEEYWLVSQTVPNRPAPQGVEVLSARQERSWHIIQLRVTVEPGLDAVLRDARCVYLNRAVAPARPDLELLWPRPLYVEPDGVRYLSRATRRLLVRSSRSSPLALSDGRELPIEADWVASDVFELLVPEGCAELKLVALGARPQRVVLSEALYVPPAVNLRCDDVRVPLLDQEAGRFASENDACHIEVPYQRLSSLVRISRVGAPDGASGRTHLALGANAISADCGNFGSIVIRDSVGPNVDDAHWTSRITAQLRNQIAPHAFRALTRVRSRSQLMAWACTYSYIRLFPVIAKVQSLESNRAISRS